MIKLFKKLFHRESTFEEVAIEARALFWQKQNKRQDVRTKWEGRKRLKIEKMKEASYLGFYRKPFSYYPYPGAIIGYGTTHYVVEQPLSLTTSKTPPHIYSKPHPYQY